MYSSDKYENGRIHAPSKDNTNNLIAIGTVYIGGKSADMIGTIGFKHQHDDDNINVFIRHGVPGIGVQVCRILIGTKIRIQFVYRII